MRKIWLSGLLLCFSFILSQHSVLAQNMESEYKTSGGFKVFFGDGTSGGFNVKHFLNETGALEGSLVFFEGPVIGLDFLYLYHGDVTGAKGLKWYMGGGGLISVVTESGYEDNVGFALRPVIGLDYKFTGAPLNVALDANPIFNIAPSTDISFAIGLAFRFAF